MLSQRRAQQPNRSKDFVSLRSKDATPRRTSRWKDTEARQLSIGGEVSQQGRLSIGGDRVRDNISLVRRTLRIRIWAPASKQSLVAACMVKTL